MIKLIPQELLYSLRGIAGYNEEAFLDTHQQGSAPTSIRLNNLKANADELDFPVSETVPWSDHGYYLGERPSFTFDPLFHAGCYYVQEASSMFLEQVIKQTTKINDTLKVLDLCASPGGKSTHLLSSMGGKGLLVTNEVIRPRALVLKDNIIRWGYSNVAVTNNDPKDFQQLPSYFDVINIDAPCSGSGLMRKDPAAIDEWSPANVHLCSARQQRIIKDVWPALKDEGIIIYSTCSYSQQEDEDILDRIIHETNAIPLQIQLKDEWKITEVRSLRGGYGYRFWPHHTRGEGFFITVLKKQEEDEIIKRKYKAKVEKLPASFTSTIQPYLQHSDQMLLMKRENSVYAWPQAQAEDLHLLLDRLSVLHTGIFMGELIRDKLIPDHSLAMSVTLNSNILRIELNYADAIRYLQRKELEINDKPAGWGVACYKGKALGWMNVLPNRINNYYPKALRILKEL